jgi:hypothetical protein
VQQFGHKGFNIWSCGFHYQRKKKELEKKRGELARQRCFTDKENQLIKGKKETREG